MFDYTLAEPGISRTLANAIFIGESGSGQSSIINLIPGDRCETIHRYFLVLQCFCRGKNVSTVGHPWVDWNFRFLVIQAVSPRDRTLSDINYFFNRHCRKELDLLVLCAQGSRALHRMSKIYKIFCSIPCQMAILVATADTHLERAQPIVGPCWLTNERQLRILRLLFNGHACLTSLSPPSQMGFTTGPLCFNFSGISTTSTNLVHARRAGIPTGFVRYALWVVEYMNFSARLSAY